MVRVQVPNITTDRAATQALQDQLIRQGMKASVGQAHQASGGGHGNGRGGHGNGHGNGHNNNNHCNIHQGKNHGNAHGNGHGHENGHNRKHKQTLTKGEDALLLPKDGPNNAEMGGKTGRVGGHGNKNLRSAPAMEAPGEEENFGLAE